jgi:hypothetical protein
MGHVLFEPGDVCGFAHNYCAGRPVASATGQPLTILSTWVQNGAGDLVQGPVNCSAVAGPAVAVDAAAIHDAFVKLLPHPAVKSAPPNGHELINVEALLWLDTTKDLNLGTTAIQGHNITLTATVSTVQWDFGDGHTDTSPGPGQPYTAADDCDTATCPDFFGHVYGPDTHTGHADGSILVTATVTWTGRYSIDTAPAQPIPGTVTSPPLTETLYLYESRGVLVPNPPAIK